MFGWYDNIRCECIFFKFISVFRFVVIVVYEFGVCVVCVIVYIGNVVRRN